jgi:hypothetical protein
MKSSGTEGPSYESTLYSHLIFDKEAKIHNGEKTASSTNAAGKNGYPSTRN